MCKCLRCGKELKSDESKKRGYGPTCYKIVSFQKNKKWKLALRKGLNTIKYRKKREIIIQNIINTPKVKSTINDDVAKEILDRVRKLELDNSYLKSRTENMIVSKGHIDEAIERIKREEAVKITDPTLVQYRNVFHECVKDLKKALGQTNYLEEGSSLIEYKTEITEELSLDELKAKHKSTYIDVQELKIVREI